MSDTLDAAAPNATSKWNFLDFRNGSVAGQLASAENGSCFDCKPTTYAICQYHKEPLETLLTEDSLRR